jgi:O-antigen/teichoic acid export membrane protein
MAITFFSRRRSNEADSSRRAARGTLQLMAAEGCAMACGYLIVILLARGLGPHIYGIYGIIMSVLLGVELIGRLGIPQALSKLIPENDAQASQLEQTGLALSLGVSAVIFGALWLSAPAIADILQIPEGAMLLRLAAIDIPFYGMYFVYDEILGGRRQFGAAALGSLIYAGGKAIGIGLLYWWELSLSGALIVNILASIAALLSIAGYISWRPIFPVRPCVAMILRLALPMALFSLGMQVLLSLDLWALRILGHGLAGETTGWYIAAANVGRLPTVASFVMMGVLIPVMSRAFSQGDMALARRYVQGAVRFLCVVLFPICVLCVLDAEGLMVLLYSSHYVEGASFLRVLVCGFGLSYTFLITFCAMLIARGLSLLAAGITLTLIPLEVLFQVLAIPSYGGIGAAAAATLALTLGAVGAGIFVYRKMGALMVPAVLPKVVLATACIAGVWTLLESTGPMLILGHIGLLGLYALILALLRELTWEDLQPLMFWRSAGVSEALSDP